MSDILTLKAYAKINLFLDVGEKRNDGYHDVYSIMQSISLFDVINVTYNKNTNCQNIRVFCEKNDIDGESNIMYKAAKKFFEFCKIDNYDISIDLTKNIPMQAGLGGGSADAASVIRALDEIYRTNLDNDKLCEIGMSVGSDVPFCIMGGTKIVLGKGEIVKNLNNMPKCYIVISMPKGSKMSTAEAYKAIDNLSVKGDMNSMISFVESEDLSGIANSLFNKFEYLMSDDSPSMVVKKIMKENGAIASMMSGSGTAVFGIAEDEISAAKVAKSVENMSDVFICEPIVY